MRSPWIALLVVPLFAGCSGDPPNGPPPVKGPPASSPLAMLPAVADVFEVRFIPNPNYKEGIWPTATLTNPQAICKVVDWLHEVDWSATPGDLRRMDVPPLCALRFIRKDGSAVSFSIYRGNIIVDNGVWRADTDRLVAILKVGAE